LIKEKLLKYLVEKVLMKLSITLRERIILNINQLKIILGDSIKITVKFKLN